MWYSSMIGSFMKVNRIDNQYYWCREPDGYLNIVKKEDAEIIND